MKLVLKNHNYPVEVIEMRNKPSMAVALENPKLRDYPEEILNSNTASMVKWLLNYLGVSEKGDNVKHHVACVEFIYTALKNYTYQEIKLAFEMYVSGQFYESNGKPMLVTQQLNAVVLGRVMREYGIRKKNELGVYRRKKEKMSRTELTNEEKDLLYLTPLIQRFDDYKQNEIGLSDVGHIYEDFIEKKIIKPYSEAKGYYNKKYAVARDLLVKFYETCGASDLEEKRKNDKIKLELKSGTSPKIQSKVKDLVLTDYFKKLVTEGKDIRDVLRPFFPVKNN